MQVVEMVVQQRGKLLTADGTYVRLDKTSVKETRDHGSVIGREQAPRGVRAPLGNQLLIIHFEIPESFRFLHEVASSLPVPVGHVWREAKDKP